MSIVYNLINYLKSWYVKEDIRKLYICIDTLTSEIDILKAQLKFHESIFLKIGMKLQLVNSEWMQKFVGEEFQRIIDQHGVDYDPNENIVKE
jgi:hypothetical protein